ncbi:MAG TPA: GNAT family N-acetyltransferase, partial [Dongiaceae bacterium]
MESALIAVPIRSLSAADLDACLNLALDQNWSGESTKWKVLLEAGDGFGIDDPLGGLAAAVVLSRTREVAVIGMLLVRRRYARQGLGTRLMAHAYAMAANAAIYLYATDE